MLTVEDIKKLTQVFAIKLDLEEFVKRDEFNSRMDEVLGRMDVMYGEVVAIRQEFSAHQIDHDRIHEDLERIKKVPVIASELKSSG